MAKYCPQCGTLLMGGWCPNCHPNPANMTAYKLHAAGTALQGLGCAITLIVMLVFFGIALFACAAA